MSFIISINFTVLLVVCFINFFHDSVQLFPSSVYIQLILLHYEYTICTVQSLSLHLLSTSCTMRSYMIQHHTASWFYLTYAVPNHLAQLPGAKTIDPGASFPAWANFAGTVSGQWHVQTEWSWRELGHALPLQLVPPNCINGVHPTGRP